MDSIFLGETEEGRIRRQNEMLERMSKAFNFKESAMPICRAKFTCLSAAESNLGNGKTSWSYKFNPVYSSDPAHENKKFWDATPGGLLEMNSVRQQSFTVGAEYYIDFTPAS